MYIQTSLWETKVTQALFTTEMKNRKRRILVVDDESLCRKMLAFLLEELCYEVHIAENGRQALTMYRNGYDAIFMDVEMPDINGIEVCKIMRSEPGYNFLPIIALTSHDDEIKTACISAGMNEFISKPVSSSALEAILNKIL